MIDGLITDYDLGSEPSQLDYIKKRNHKSSSTKISLLCVYRILITGLWLCYFFLLPGMEEGKKLSNVYDTVQCTANAISNKKQCAIDCY